MTAKTYTINLIADLLKVPSERRAACLRQIEYALQLHELAFGEDAEEAELGDITWIDDGDKSVQINDPSGQFLRLEVTDVEEDA